MRALQALRIGSKPIGAKLKIKKMPNKNYKYISKPKHPKADKNGYVYEHIIIAEEILGRYLTNIEVAHHIDENPKNNTKSNIMVFNSNGDHARYHKTGIAFILTTGAYVSPKHIGGIRKRYGLCIKCDNQCSYKAGLCLTCFNEERKNHIPSKKELQELLWKIPSTHIAKKYNVSDKAIKRWCKKYDITKPPRGYWAKFQIEKLRERAKRPITHGIFNGYRRGCRCTACKKSNTDKMRRYRLRKEKKLVEE